MGSEIAARADFSGVRYAQCWEDADVLLEALDVRPGHVCLSIASAGDNALALLSRGPARVIALDLSPAQLACVELRVAAYRALQHPELLELIGSVPCTRRQELYRRFRPLLSGPVRDFWDARPADIEAGIGSAGKFERYFALFRRRVLPLVHGRRAVQELLRGGTAEERRLFYAREWDTWRWRLMFRLFFSRAVMGRMGRDPAFFDYVEGGVAGRILGRARHALTVLDPAGNPYLQWILLGRHGTALPYALRPENFEAIRTNLDRFEWHCMSVEDYLDAHPDLGVDRYNLSDIFEYMSAESYHALLEKLVAWGRPGGRLAYWNMLVPRSRPEDMAARLRPLTELAARLHQQDKAFFYSRFVVEEIVGCMIDPWLGMALMLTALGVWMAVLRVYQSVAGPHPEVVRKLMHVGMGLTVLAFPWLFHDVWPVVAIGVLSVALLAAVRLLSGLRRQLGGVLGGVARKSLGEFYFAVSVAALFALSRGQPYANILYCVPILVLALADAVATLIGVRYGQFQYATVDGKKSAEGSTAFFLAAFFSVHVPLLLLTDVGRAETLLIALVVGFLIMLFEAIAWRGLDNLFIPLVCFLVLKIYLGPPGLGVGALVARVVVLLALFAFVLLWRSRSTLDASGLLAGALVGYLAWALGDWRWLVFPLMLFLSYTLLSPRTAFNTRRVHNVHAVMSACGAGLVWLFLARTLNRPELLLPYAVAFAANLAIIGLARLRYDYPARPAPVLLTTCIVKGWLILFVPFVLIAGASPSSFRCALIALVGVAGAAVLFYMTQPGMEDCPTDTPRWLRQAASSALGSAVGLVPLYLL